MQIRTARPEDRDAILRMSDASDSTPRTIDTWDGNPLRAVLAFDGETLIGMLPIEERCWEIGYGDRLKVLWATGVHVDASYRRHGIGSKLDAFVEKTFADQFDAICVFREDETSQAYNWYRKNGFYPLAHIVAFRLPVAEAAPAAIAAQFTCRHLTTREALSEAGAELAAQFDGLRGSYGGFRARTPDFWEAVWDHHYYRSAYRYSVLTLQSDSGIVAFALLGETSMRDDVSRYDLLEFVAAEGEAEDNLHAAVVNAARRAGLGEIRIQTTADDRRVAWLSRLGYTNRNRSTNILGKVLAPGRILAKISQKPGRRSAWHTDRWGVIGPGPDGSGAVKASDAALTAFCFHRLSPTNANATGNPYSLSQETAAARDSDDTPAPWRYFQVDYI